MRTYKILDFSLKGNVIRLYLGDPELNYWWGDDWNDAPYECNAGTVYEEYYTATVDFAFGYDFDVLEPSNTYPSRYLSKEDMQKKKAPCIIIVKDEETWSMNDYYVALGLKDNIKIYIGDIIFIDFERNIIGSEGSFTKKYLSFEENSGK